MKTCRAFFTIARVSAGILFIIDRNEGTTVTNDAEAVVERCLELYPGKRIVYRDTEGRWDELTHDNEKFTGFAPFSGDHP